MSNEITITIDARSLARMKQELEQKPKLMRRELVRCINDTARHSRTEISSRIRERVNIKKKDIDKHIKVDLADGDHLEATVTLEKTARIPLKYFGARQTKKGVTYKISKGPAPPKNAKRRTGKNGGKERIPDAFGPKIPRLGGNVFKRAGKKRLPIIKLLGPSAWGVFHKHGLREPTVEENRAFFRRRIEQRLKYLAERSRA